MYADSLIIGCLAAHLVAQRARVPSLLEAPALKVVAFACIVVGRVLQLAEPAASPIVALVPGVQAVAIMFLIWSTAFLRPGLLSRLLNLRGVVFVGVLSYSIYVWQFLFVANFVPRLAGRCTHDWKWWMPCAVAVAAASYYGVERPFLKLKTRFGKREDAY
jgi:peptidoglycan/LPS O-acetylase OafA/YrhL